MAQLRSHLIHRTVSSQSRPQGPGLASYGLSLFYAPQLAPNMNCLVLVVILYNSLWMNPKAFVYLQPSYPKEQVNTRLPTMMRRNKLLWRGCGEKGTLLHCGWECKLVQSLWRTVRRLLRKLKIELPYDPAIPLLDIYPEKMKTII